MRVFVRKVLPLFFLFASALTAAAQSATGSITVDGKKTALDHAVAVRLKDGRVRVLISDQDVAAPVLKDDFGRMHLKSLSGVEVEITADGQIPTGTLYSPGFTKMNGSFSASGMHKWSGTIGADTIEGTLSLPSDSFAGYQYAYTATFKAPISSGAAPPPKGTPLPSGGGAPGKAYRDYLGYVAAGNVAKVRGAVSAARATQASDADVKKMLPMIQALSPKDIKIVSATIDGNHATLLTTGKDTDGPSAGTIDMVLEGGAWKVEKESWKSGDR
jgi:hypothetical protein